MHLLPLGTSAKAPMSKLLGHKFGVVRWCSQNLCTTTTLWRVLLGCAAAFVVVPTSACRALFGDAHQVVIENAAGGPPTLIASQAPHSAFPGVALVNDSELVVVFREGSYHESEDGSIALVRSTDGGQTFSAPVTIFDTPYDDRDPLLVRLSDGRLAIQFTTLLPDRGHYRAYISFSSDNGRSWTPPRDPDPPPYAHPDGSRGALLEVAPNALISPAAVDTATYFYRSTDGGAAWTFFSQVAARRRQFWEATMVQVPGGRLIAAFRTMSPDGNGYVHDAESRDGGAHWSSPRRLPFWGFPQHLVLLDSSSVLMTYGYREPPYGGHPPYGVRYRISTDLGRTWTNDQEWIVEDRSVTIDCGYPWAVVMPDHTVFVAYYVTLEPGKAEVWGRRLSDPRLAGLAPPPAR